VLKENEEQLLQMPFEVMLTQIVNMPIKFFVKEFGSAEKELAAVEDFDRRVSKLKIPTILLERLKHEFDQNYKISVQTSNQKTN
jgi:hypothetical protein